MNFFGHAVIAGRRRPVPGFVLGAMLPDFATMLRRRLPRTSHPELGSGVSFHHLTDAVFHDAPTFRELMSDAYRRLTSAGLARGPARAVAHVGVELLIDAVLAHDAAAVTAYRAALHAAHPGGLGSEIEWTEHDAPQRFEELRSVLCAREPSRSRVAPAAVAVRLRRVLSDRPRLALDDRDERIVERWCDEAQTHIAECTPTVIAQVDAGLASAS